MLNRILVSPQFCNLLCRFILFSSCGCHHVWALVSVPHAEESGIKLASAMVKLYSDENMDPLTRDIEQLISFGEKAFERPILRGPRFIDLDRERKIWDVSKNEEARPLDVISSAAEQILLQINYRIQKIGRPGFRVFHFPEADSREDEEETVMKLVFDRNRRLPTLIDTLKSLNKLSFKSANRENPEDMRKTTEELRAKAISILNFLAKYAPEAGSVNFFRKVLEDREVIEIVKEHIIWVSAHYSEDLMVYRGIKNFILTHLNSSHYHYILKSFKPDDATDLCVRMLCNFFEDIRRSLPPKLVPRDYAYDVVHLGSDVETFKGLFGTPDDKARYLGTLMNYIFGSNTCLQTSLSPRLSVYLWNVNYYSLEYVMNHFQSQFRIHFWSQLQNRQLGEKIQLHCAASSFSRPLLKEIARRQAIILKSPHFSREEVLQKLKEPQLINWAKKTLERDIKWANQIASLYLNLRSRATRIQTLEITPRSSVRHVKMHELGGWVLHQLHRSWEDLFSKIIFCSRRLVEIDKAWFMQLSSMTTKREREESQDFLSNKAARLMDSGRGTASSREH